MSLTTDTISVIIPLYNAERYIASALESVYAQTYQDFEIIVIDDGSVDGGGTVCRQFAKEKGKLRFFSQKNRGVGPTRNVGIREARGEYLLFLDADDFLAEDALASLVQCQRETDADLVIGGYDSVFEDGDLKLHHELFPQSGDHSLGNYCLMTKREVDDFTADFEAYPKNHYIMSFCWGRLFRTNIFRDNSLSCNEKTWFADDSILMLEYVTYVQRMAILKKSCLFYREYETSVSISTRITDGEALLRDAEFFFNAVVRFLTENQLYDEKTAQERAAWKVVGNLIIKMIKSSRGVNSQNKQAILREITTIASSSFTQNLLRLYHPRPGNSKLLPFLMRIRSSRLLLWACRRRASRRYKSSR
jgi:glycosyltransferase involved in cell wall biosynthesis